MIIAARCGCRSAIRYYFVATWSPQIDSHAGGCDVVAIERFVVIVSRCGRYRRMCLYLFAMLLPIEIFCLRFSRHFFIFKFRIHIFAYCIGGAPRMDFWSSSRSQPCSRQRAGGHARNAHDLNTGLHNDGPRCPSH